MSLEKITDVGDRAVARLTSNFKEKPLIEAVLRALVQEHQTLEDVFDQIYKFRWLNTAIGKQLDGVGSIVGEDRRGRNDDVYRLAIKLRIAINTSKGTPEDLITVFLLLTLCNEAHYIGTFPAACEIYGDFDFSQMLLGAGPDAFAFDGGPDGLGFGDVFDPDVGGMFAYLQLADLDYILAILTSVIPAGVLLDHIGYYDGDDAFAFDGMAKYKGFGSVFDNTVGGKFASILI